MRLRAPGSWAQSQPTDLSTGRDPEMSDKCLPRHLANPTRRVWIGGPAGRPNEIHLTTREAEVLHWVAQAKRNAEIAIILGISERTVQKHMERILATLGVENRTAAANVAREFL